MNNKPTRPVQFRLSIEDYVNLINKAAHLLLNLSDYIRFLVKMGELATSIQILKDMCEGLYGKIPPQRDLNKYLEDIKELEKQQRNLWQNLQINITQRNKIIQMNITQRKIS